MKPCIRQLLNYHVPPKRQSAERVEYGWDAVAIPLSISTEIIRLWNDLNTQYERAVREAFFGPYPPTADSRPATRARS